MIVNMPAHMATRMATPLSDLFLWIPVWIPDSQAEVYLEAINGDQLKQDTTSRKCLKAGERTFGFDR